MPIKLSLERLADRLAQAGTVFVPGASAEPVELTQLLVAQPAYGAGTRFMAAFVPGMNRANLASAATQRRMHSFFMPPEYQADWRAGLIDFTPTSYFGAHRLVASAQSGITTLVVQVAAPDRHGLCSLGAAGELVPSAIRAGVRVLGLINPRVPAIPHALQVPFDAFDAVAESVVPLANYDVGPASAVAEQIATHLAGLIPDGASLQLGLGKIPAQLAKALRPRRRLRLYSGMLSDSFLDLVDAECLDPDAPIVVGMIVGSAELYARLSQLPQLRMASVAETHAPEALAAVPALYAINSALEVDLLGQVNAEVQGGSYVSGPGGLPDFAAAAHRQADGLSVIALPSSGAGGKLSRIVASFGAGVPVTVPKHDVDASVTEYGVALIKNVDLDQRALRIAAIAHPNHRDTLQEAAKRLFRA